MGDDRRKDMDNKKFLIQTGLQIGAMVVVAASAYWTFITATNYRLTDLEETSKEYKIQITNNSDNIEKLHLEAVKSLGSIDTKITGLTIEQRMITEKVNNLERKLQ